MRRPAGPRDGAPGDSSARRGTSLRDELGALVHVLLAVGTDRVDDLVVPLGAAEVVLPRGGCDLERHPGVVLEEELVIAGLALERLVEDRLEGVDHLRRRAGLPLHFDASVLERVDVALL